MKKTVIIYGLLLGVVLIGLKTLEYKWLIRDLSQQLYIFLIALFFMALGVWLSYQFIHKNNNNEFEQNTQAVVALGLSARELQVLEKLAEGLSNQQIADTLFVSVNTVKTHLKNGFIKLEVNNRVQAINKLKSLNVVE